MVISSPAKSSNIVYWLGNSLYLNITNRCSNECYFCLRKFKNGIGRFKLKLQQEPSSGAVIKELKAALKKEHYKEVVFCGFGEPLERLDCVLEVTRWLKRYSGKVVRINTNGHGYLLNKGLDVIAKLKKAGVDKISVSVNAHNEDTYDRICNPRFEDAFEEVLAFVQKAKEQFDTEMTMVALPEVEICGVRKIAGKLGVAFRVREYLPCFY